MPKFKQVKIDETKHWNKDFLKKNNLKKMLGVYVYNSDEVTHCCELTPSYFLNFVHTDYEFEIYPDDNDIRESINCAIIEIDLIREFEIYMHCRDIDKLDSINLGEFDNIDEAVEDANANWR